MAKVYGAKSTYADKMLRLLRAFESIYIFIAGAFSYAIISSTLMSAKDLSAGAFIGFFILALVCLPFYLHIWERVKKFRTDERKFIKGSKGEGKAFYTLKDLPDQFTVIQNVLISDKGNIDFVVIGKHKVFTIEVKSHSGSIDFDGQNLVKDGKLFEKEIIKQAKAQAASLSKHIAQNVEKSVWVEPVVVFTGTTKLRFGMKKVAGVYVIGIKWLNDLLQKEDNDSVIIEENLKQIFIDKLSS